jgi:hypothetical protein
MERKHDQKIRYREGLKLDKEGFMGKIMDNKMDNKGIFP